MPELKTLFFYPVDGTVDDGMAMVIFAPRRA